MDTVPTMSGNEVIDAGCMKWLTEVGAGLLR